MKKLVCLIGVFVLLALAALAHGATYYVDATLGDDANDGLAGTTGGGHGPWQSISKVSSLAATFSPNDSILFKRGETWGCASLTLPTAATAAGPITLGAYGTGADPILSGLHTVDWFAQGMADGHLWKEDGDETGGGLALTDPSGWTLASANLTLGTWGVGGGDLGVTAPTSGGTYGIKIDDTGTAGYLSYVADTPVRQISIEFDVRTPTADDQSVPVVVFSSGGTGVCAARFYTGGGVGKTRFQWWNGIAGSGIGYSEAIDQGVWLKARATCAVDVGRKMAYLSFRYSIDDGANWTICNTAISSIDLQNEDPAITTIDGVSVSDGFNELSAADQPVYVDNVRVGFAPIDTAEGIWAAYDRSAYSSATGLPEGLLIVDDEDYGLPESDAASVDAPGEWFCELDNSTDSELIVYMYDDPSGSTVDIPCRNSVLTFPSGTDYIIVQDLVLRGSNSSTVALTGGDGIVVQRCTIYWSSYGGIATSAGDGAVLRYNDISYCHHAGTFANGTCANLVIMDNRYHDCLYQGIALETIDSALVQGNLIYSITPLAVLAYGIECGKAAENAAGVLVVQDNTIYDCGTACINTADTDSAGGALYKLLIIQRNIAVAKTSQVALRIRPGGSDEGNRLIDYNCLWHEDSDGVVVDDGTTYTRSQLATWQAASPFSANDVWNNPRFGDAANGDFRLFSDSPARTMARGPDESVMAMIGAVRNRAPARR